MEMTCTFKSSKECTHVLQRPLVCADFKQRWSGLLQAESKFFEGPDSESNSGRHPSIANTRNQIKLVTGYNDTL